MQYKDIESFPDLWKKSLVIALNETSNILFQKLEKENLIFNLTGQYLLPVI